MKNSALDILVVLAVLALSVIDVHGVSLTDFAAPEPSVEDCDAELLHPPPHLLVVRNGGNVTADDDEVIDLRLESRVTLNRLIFDCTHRLGLPLHGTRAFRANGLLMDNLRNVKNGDVVVLVPPDEHFMYPPMYLGFRNEVARGLFMETLSVQPRVFLLDGLIQEAEIDALMRAASSNFEQSRVEDGATQPKVRNSESAFVSTHTEDPALQSVFHKARYVTRIRQASHWEQIQVTRYSEGGRYDLHSDYYQEAPRWASLLIYLTDNDAREGTCFPYAKDAPKSLPVGSVSEKTTPCVHGLCIQPVKGRALLWYNVDPSKLGESDPRAKHSGCPVGPKGKLVATLWANEKPRLPRVHY